MLKGIKTNPQKQKQKTNRHFSNHFLKLVLKNKISDGFAKISLRFQQSKHCNLFFLKSECKNFSHLCLKNFILKKIVIDIPKKHHLINVIVIMTSNLLKNNFF